MKFRYFLINKPYGVLSQFTDENERKTLGAIFNFPKDVYPVGRLDLDSEGLLLLTNDKELNNLLLNPKFKHEREYHIQVEGVPDESALERLRKGVTIEGKKTLPAKAEFFLQAPDYPDRIPPIRERKNIPTSWIRLILIEGRNRQVRKMTAHVGFPTLRLIRARIGTLTLGNMIYGEVIELNLDIIKELKKMLKSQKQIIFKKPIDK